METRPNAVCATSALAEAVALDAARAGDTGIRFTIRPELVLDGDEARLEVGGHERDDASARHRGQKPLRHRPGDERRGGGDEELAALHAP